MPNKITVTGTLGPALAVTSLVFNNVQALDFKLVKGILEITYEDPIGNTRITNFDLTLVTTVTYTISSGIATVVAS